MTVSTPALAERVAPLARRVEVVPNAIDERLFLVGLHEPAAVRAAGAGRPVRLVYIGSHHPRARISSCCGP